MSRENAPYDLMFKLRYYAEKNDVRFIDLSCFRCTSVYASLPFAIWLSWNNFWYIPIYVLALSGAVTIINFIMDKLDNEL